MAWPPPRRIALGSETKDRSVLSINDTPLAREVFGRFDLVEVPVTFPDGTSHDASHRRIARAGALPSVSRLVGQFVTPRVVRSLDAVQSQQKPCYVGI